MPTEVARVSIAKTCDERNVMKLTESLLFLVSETVKSGQEIMMGSDVRVTVTLAIDVVDDE